MSYTADKKPLELTALTSLATDDTILVGDTSDTSEVAKTITKANLITDLSSSFATAAQGALADTATQPADIANFETTTQLNTRDTNNRDTDNHTSGTTNKVYTATEQTKLAGIETSADVTDTTNVTAAGALMDSEVTDLAGIKALDTSTLQVKPAEGAFVDGDKTKLDGIETAADVTDATNVSAAGAPIISSGAGAPASTPSKVGDIYIDTTGDIVYIAKGTASSADWTVSGDTAVSATEYGYLNGVTSAIQTQINAKAPTASPTFTGTVTLPTGLTGVIRTDSGVVSVDSDVTDIVSAASTTVAGKVEMDTDAEFTTGTDETRYVNAKQVASVAQTMTNKTMIATTNVISENTTVASSATPTPTYGSLRNFFTVTALATNATFAAPTGTPASGKIVLIRVKYDGTTRTLAWNAIYRAVGVTLPTATVANKTIYLIGVYNSADTKLDIVGVQEEA